MAIALLAILIFICLGAVYYLHSEINTHSLVLRKMNSDIQALMQRPMQIFPQQQHHHHSQAQSFSPPSYIPAVNDEDGDDEGEDTDLYGVCVEDTDSSDSCGSDSDDDEGEGEDDDDDSDVTEVIARDEPFVPVVGAMEPAEPVNPDTVSLAEGPQEPQDPQEPQEKEKKPSPPEEPAKNYDEGYEMEHEGVVYQVKQDKNGRKRWAKKSNKPTTTTQTTGSDAQDSHTLNLMD